MRRWLKRRLSALLSGSLILGMACFGDMTNVSAAENGFKENFLISPVISCDETLQNTYEGSEVSWSGEFVSEDGKVKEVSEDTDTTVKATYSVNGATEEKEFPVKILSKKAYKLEAYTREALAKDVYSGKLAYSLHLAVKNDSGYQALYDNCGLMYAKAEIAANGKLNPKNLKNPYVFYMKDGQYGIISVRTDSAKTEASDKEDASSKGKALLCTTYDFIHYEEQGLIDLGVSKYVSDVICDYDSALDTYVIRWKDTDGAYYKSTAKDILSLKADTKDGDEFSVKPELTGIEGACERNYFYVPEAVGKKVVSKFSTIYNTGVSLPEVKLYTDDGKDAEQKQLEGTKATLLYSDGSTAQKSVDWDTSTVDFAKEGEYSVTGLVQKAPAMKASNDTSLGVNRADPCIYYNDKDGYYYFIATNDANGNATFGVRKSKTIEGLREAEESEILSVDDYDDVNMCLWAPEFHVIGGEMYIFFAANPADGWNVQCFVMKLSGDDMTKKEDWDKPIRFLGMDGKPLTNACDIGGITLDMTSFELNGQTYVCWTQRDFGKETGSIICIGTIEPSEPWKLTSKPVLICRPDYGWDNNDDTPVDEGPYAIITDSSIFITFSGSSVGATYCVGMLKADINADLLDENSWTKSNFPILYPRAVEGEAGPGHNSYTTDEAGNLVFVYHARPVDDKGNVGSRNTGLRTVHFDVDGEPVLYMYGDLELAYEYEEVTLKVVVTSKDTENKKQQEKPPVVTVNPPVVTQSPDKKPDVNVKKGETVTDGKYTYKVTDVSASGEASVSVIKVSDKKIKSAVIGSTVSINGVTYKITEIGNGAFKGCKNLKKVTIGKNVTKIGNKAFSNCSKLKKIIVKGSKIKKVGKKAFNKVSKNVIAKVPKKAAKKYKKLFKGVKVK